MGEEVNVSTRIERANQFIKQTVPSIQHTCVCGTEFIYQFDLANEAVCPQCGIHYQATFKDTHTEDATGIPINEWYLKAKPPENPNRHAPVLSRYQYRKKKIMERMSPTPG